MQAKRAQASLSSDDTGAFDMVLSNGTTDRDGDTLLPEQWKQPLPESISINVNHSSDVQNIVASGKPFIDADGNLRVRGTFAGTQQAQHIRELVNGHHLRSVSVEFLKHGDGSHELVGGAFVNIPSNPDARVIESKGQMTNDEFVLRLKEILFGDMKSASDPTAIHDGSVYLDAQCVDTGSNDDEGDNKALALKARLKAIQG